MAMKQQGGGIFNPGIVGALLLGAVALLLLGVMAYSSLRRTASRLSCDFYYPYLRLASKLESSVASEALMLKSKFTLARAIEYLQTDNFELTSKLSQLGELERENARLREMLSIGSRASFLPVYAEVIARDPSSWYDRFTIGRGSDNGVAEGDLVVSPAPSPDGGKLVPAVVGRIKSVTRRTASVCTLSSEDCKLSVVLSGSGVSGLLEGAGLSEGVPMPSVKFLPLKPVYKVGDVVGTSGVSDATPPSILVGRLCPWPSGAVTVERDHIYTEARVLPSADLDSVRFVSVFTKVRR
jgi:rod shape-determining protein MreC